MSAHIYILFFLVFGNGNTTVVTQQFDTRDACYAAAHELKESLKSASESRRYHTICVKRGHPQ